MVVFIDKKYFVVLRVVESLERIRQKRLMMNEREVNVRVGKKITS